MDRLPRSEYLENEKRVNPDSEYVLKLERLRELIREGNFGYARTEEMRRNPELRSEYRRLQKDYPEAYGAFAEEHRQEAFRRCEYSPYLEKMEKGLPDTDENRVHLRDLKRLRKQMLLMKLGYGGQGLGMMRHSLGRRYPQAHDTFKEEIRVQLGS